MVNVTDKMFSGEFRNSSRNSTLYINEELPAALKIVMDLVMFGIASFIIVANVFTSMGLLKCHRMSLQIKALSLCLNSAGICIGIFLLLSLISDYFSVLKNDIFICSSIFYGFRTATLVCLGTLASFAVDRALSVVFAMRYYSNVTQNTSFVWCVAIWITSISLTVISFREGFSQVQNCFKDPDNNALGAEYLIVSALVCFVLIILSYAIIFRKVIEYIGEILPKGHNAPSVSKSRYHYRASIKILILILLFVMFFLPSGIYIAVVAFKTELKYNSPLLRRIVGLFYLLNSCANPVMYAWRFKECRLHCKALLCVWNKNKLSAIKRKQMLYYCNYIQSHDDPTDCSVQCNYANNEYDNR